MCLLEERAFCTDNIIQEHNSTIHCAVKRTNCTNLPIAGYAGLQVDLAQPVHYPTKPSCQPLDGPAIPQIPSARDTYEKLSQEWSDGMTEVGNCFSFIPQLPIAASACQTS